MRIVNKLRHDTPWLRPDVTLIVSRLDFQINFFDYTKAKFVIHFDKKIFGSNSHMTTLTKVFYWKG